MSARISARRFSYGANPARAQAMVEKRRSNAAGKHADKRTKRARTRGAAKARALKEW